MYRGGPRAIHFASFLKDVRSVASTQATSTFRRPCRKLSQQIQSSGATQCSEVDFGWAERALLRRNEPQQGAKDRNKKPFRETIVNIFSKNERGLTKDAHMEETIAWMERHQGYAAGLQETWKLGDTQEQHRNYVIINHGPKEKLCKRGSLGVAIVLGPEARKAWEEAGNQVMYFGPRIIATRLKAPDSKGKHLTLYLVSAYSPTSAAKPAEMDKYNTDMQRCIDACGKREVMVMCSDTNASTGVRHNRDNPYEKGRDQVRGPFGNRHQNRAGRDLVSTLGINQLCLPTTYFKKTTYCTWINPCNKLGHQLDHFIMKQADLKRVRDAGFFGVQGKHSDHYPIRIRLSIGRSLKKLSRNTSNNNSESNTYNSKSRIDRKLLTVQEHRDLFISTCKKEYYSNNVDNPMTKLIKAMQSAAKTALTSTKRRQPGWYEAAKDYIEPAVLARNSAQIDYNRNPTSKHKQALKHTRKHVKATVATAEKVWLQAILDKISLFTEKGPLNAAKAWTAIATLRGGKSVTKKLTSMQLRNSDGVLSKTPKENASIMKTNLETVFSKEGKYDPTVLALIRQRDKRTYKWLDMPPTTLETSTAIMKLGNDKSGGDTKTPAEFYKVLEEDAEAREFIRTANEHFWKSGSYSDDMNEILKFKRPTPTPLPEKNLDIIKYIGEHTWQITFGPNPHKSGSKLQATYNKFKMSTTVNDAINNGATRPLLAKYLEKKQITLHDPADQPDTSDIAPLKDDSNAVVYEEWQLASLKLLPKKGDLSLCKNWRGICLLDIASKVLSSVMVARMQEVQKHEGLEAQAGFSKNRGTIDGLFNTFIAMSKRKEHNLETWVLFIDLVKAFDTVPRELLFQILRKFGLPDHFVNIVIRLHTNAKIKFEVGNIESEVGSNIGVRQGSNEGPVLFIFIIQAAMETMEWPVPKPQFCTLAGPKGSTHGMRSEGNKKSEEKFDLHASLFADDCALLFETRQDLIIGANHLYPHFLRFGLHIHLGRGDEKSKTEAMFCPARGKGLDSGCTDNFDVADGFVSFTTEFKYLGSMINYSLTSTTDVNKRITDASAAFGALSCIFDKKHISRRIKGKIYQSLILSILLYGSECWSLTQKLYLRLQSFHRKCARKLCNITMQHTIRRHIRTSDVLEQAGIRSFSYYYNTRLLRWAGHIARMDMDRLPRKLLTGWVDNKRAQGHPFQTWGHTLKKALVIAGIPTEFETWALTLAKDKNWWRNKLKHVDI